MGAPRRGQTVGDATREKKTKNVVDCSWKIKTIKQLTEQNNKIVLIDDNIQEITGLTTSNSFDSSVSYDKIVLFPNFGASNSADLIYYFDEIKQSN